MSDPIPNSPSLQTIKDYLHGDGSNSLQSMATFAQNDGNGITDSQRDFEGYVYDDTAPSVPQNLTVDSKSNSTGDFTISWDASSDNRSGVKHYNIYKNGNFITTRTGTSYSGSLSGGSSDDFTVSAVDNDDNESAQSNSVTITIEDTSPPTVPNNLTGTGSSDGSGDFSLSWDASSDPQSGVDYYQIYNHGSDPNNGGIEYAQTTATSYNGNLGPPSGIETQYFSVSAVNNDGYESAKTDPESVTLR